MPKNPVTDPITDQEINFAHLILSGTMTDSQAAKAAGLNPTTAGYIKSKPRVRDYMIEHRNAVNEKLVDQEAEALRDLNLGREQILRRLWELASLDPEATRGSITGQVKAMSMLIAIKGLIPDRRRSLMPNIDLAEALRRHQAEAMEPSQPASAAQEQPAASKAPDQPTPPTTTTTSVPSHINNPPTPNAPFLNSKAVGWVQEPVNPYDVHIKPIDPLSMAIPRSAYGR